MWNKTSDGFPTHEQPVLVSNGGVIRSALAVWTDYGEDTGWLWEGHIFGPINTIESYECDDEYEFDYWMEMPKLPTGVNDV